MTTVRTGSIEAAGAGRQVPRYRIGIDTGGTFTDVVAFDRTSGTMHTSKTPTTPADPSTGVLDALRKIAVVGRFQLSDVASIAHGTTIATNAVLAEEFPGLGLVVTRGFQHILEIARQSVPQGYGNSYFWVKPERIVPLHLVREVDERLDVRGNVLQPFDVAEAEAAAEFFRRRGIDCIGVCFLHSYANPSHERQMRHVLDRVYPEASVSLSSDVLAEYREYERAVTTLVDAFVKPRVSQYVAQIQVRLAAAIGPQVPFYIMKSNGGVMSAREVGAQPIATLLSGPAAGALGATLVAEAAGFPRVLTLDGGGTSTDVAVIDGGVPHVTTEGRVGRYPVKVPMIDVVTVGAGGGSLAVLGGDGCLRVGPRSAGAEPGPMCYGRGGQVPTVTDAALLLGHIPPRLLGGEIPLDVAASRRGLDALAARLGLDPFQAAAGVLEIAAWSQANAVRQVSVKRGLDVRDYLLVAFGGSGPLQAGRLVDLLGLTQGALIPPDPGNLSAFGLLTVDLKNDYVRTAVEPDDDLDLSRTNALFSDLEQQASRALLAEGYMAQAVRLVRSADLRYFGQAWEVRVDVPDGELDRAAADEVVTRFHAAHERTYGYSYQNQPHQAVEWVNLRLTGIGPIERPALQRRPRPFGDDSQRAISERRTTYFDGQVVETPVYQRPRLQPGDCLSGPAVIEEFGSTIVVPPSLRASVDAVGNVLLKLHHA